MSTNLDNPAVARGQAAAISQERANREAELAVKIRDLGTIRKRTGSPVATHDAYERAYAKILNLAQVVATWRGEVQIPAYDPPPLPTEQKSVTVTARAPAPAEYAETAGKGPSGKGLPQRPIPGSGSDNGAW